MVAFKSRKQKNLKKQRKNKTKRRNCTLKKSKHKSYRKTRHYYNVRQHIGGGLEDSESSYTPPMGPGWESSPPPELTFALQPSPNSPVVSPLNPPAVPPLVPPNSPPPPSPSPPSPSPPPPSPSPPPPSSSSWRNPPSRPPPLPSRPPSIRPSRPPNSLGSVLPQPQSFILEQPGLLVVLIAGSLGLVCICICNMRAIGDHVSYGVGALRDSVHTIGRNLQSPTTHPRRLQSAPNPRENPGQDIEMQPAQVVPIYRPGMYEKGYAPKFIAYTDDDVCAVCLEKFQDDPDKPITRLHKCGHLFHSECIDDWFNLNHWTCPACKEDADSKEPIPDYTSLFKLIAGGANSLLDTIAKLLKGINILETSALTETLMTYFDFLHLEPKHYRRIVELLKTINEDSNLEELITILADGLGLNCSQNNETLESSATTSDERLVKILGANGESIINAIVQKCSSNNDLKLTAKQIIDVESIKNSLAETLSSYCDEPNKKQAEKQTKEQLLRDLELSRATFNSILD